MSSTTAQIFTVSVKTPPYMEVRVEAITQTARVQGLT